MVDITSLGAAIYNIGAPQVIAKVPCLRNEHYMYPVADLTKTDYYGVGALAEQRKINQGRTLTEIDANQVKTTVPPEFYGGCSVIGFYTGGAWKLYYQTWGAMSYERPAEEVIKALLTAH
jgi:hypothetical protein